MTGNPIAGHASVTPSLTSITGIVAALPEELATLTSRKLARGDCVCLAEDVLIVYAGAGPVNAGHAAKQLITQGANRLISWGCAAALAPQLKPGNLVIPDQVLYQQHSYDTDHAWSAHVKNRLEGKLSPVDGTLAASAELVANSIDKQRIHQQSGAVALDMESGAVVQAANQAGLPSLVIRAIADPVSMDLPQAVARALNPEGQVELGKLLRHLLTHPWEIPTLIKLGLHFHAAQKTLKTVAEQLTELIHF